MPVCPDGRMVWGVSTDCSLSRITKGSAMMAEGSKALPLTAGCLAPLPCLVQKKSHLAFGFNCIAHAGLPWCGSRRCPWLLVISHHWGSVLIAKWSEALPLTAGSLAPLPCLVQKKSHLAFGFVCIAHAKLPCWPRGLRRFHWLLAVSHHWGFALMAEGSKALPLTAGCLAPLPCLVQKKSHLALVSIALRMPVYPRVVQGVAPDCSLSRITKGSAMMAEWSAALPLTAGCLAPLPCLVQKKSHLAFGFVCIAHASLPWWPRGLRRCHWLQAVSHHCLVLCRRSLI